MNGMNKNHWVGLLASLASMTMTAAPALAQQQKPNILVIMADDIGYWNISARHAEPIDTSASHVGFRCVKRRIAS
jgi:hypothetical protein